MATGGHPPPEYAQKSLYVQQPSLRAGVLWFINITERRPLIAARSCQNAGQTQRWYRTASANLRGRLYLHRGIERTYTRDLLVEVFLDGRGNGLNH